jgi:hypothetical protein
VAHQYAKAGAEVVVALDVTPFSAKLLQMPGLTAEPRTLAKGLWYTARNRVQGVLIRSGVRAIRVEGSRQVEALVYTDKAGAEHRIACDAVGASFGLRSETQLADLAACRFVFDPVGRQWVPERTPEGRSSVSASRPAIIFSGICMKSRFISTLSIIRMPGT